MKKISLIVASALLILGISVHAEKLFNDDDPYYSPPSSKVEAGVNAVGALPEYCQTCAAAISAQAILPKNQYNNALADDSQADAKSPTKADEAK